MTRRYGLTRGDRWVLSAALLALAAAWAALGGDEGGMALVTQEGRVVARLDLERPTRLTVDGPLGQTVLEVAEGRVRFLSSPCRGQLCVHAGWLSQGGAFAACLPNGVAVRIAARSERYDAINF